MERLPVEILGHIAGYLDVQGATYQHRSTQRDLAALARTSKALSRFMTDRLYRSPTLETKKQISTYLRTFTGDINPFSRAVNEYGVWENPPQKLTLRHPGGWRVRKLVLPDLRFYDECYGFLYLTTLRFIDCEDPTHIIPYLLRPSSLWRESTVVELELVGTSTYGADNVGLSFILEAALYGDPRCFVDAPIVPASDLFTKTLGFSDPYDRNTYHPFGPMKELEDIPSPSTEVIAKAQYDFDTFASTWAWRRIVELGLLSHCYYLQSGGHPSVWSALRSLTLEVRGPHHILLLLGGYSFQDLTTLKLTGSKIDLTDNLILYCRPSITRIADVSKRFEGRDDSRDTHGRCIAPEKIALHRNRLPWRITASNLRYITGRKALEWDPLDEDEVDAADAHYFGPQLEFLDLSELHAIVR